MKEIEVRFKLKDVDLFVNNLIQHGAIKGVTEIQNDLYYKLKGYEKEGDIPGSSIYRVRYGSSDYMQIVRKTTINPGIWDEQEVSINKEHAYFFINILDSSMSKTISISKKRVEYKIDDFTICVDQIDNLGDFVEIELLVDNDIDLNRERVFKLAEKLGVNSNDIVTDGYVTLMKKKMK